MLTVTIDRDACIATCAGIAPGIFDTDDDGKCFVCQASIDETHEALVLEAAETCPVTAITVVKDGRQVYP